MCKTRLRYRIIGKLIYETLPDRLSVGLITFACTLQGGVPAALALVEGPGPGNVLEGAVGRRVPPHQSYTAELWIRIRSLDKHWMQIQMRPERFTYTFCYLNVYCSTILR